MMIIRGVNLFPSHVEQLLLSVEGVAPHWRLVLERTGPMDELTLECEPADTGVDRGALASRLEHVLKESTGVRIVVAVLDPGTVPRSEGKAVRVVDRR
jgi:phenylacetate-CoA ligase